MHRHSLSIIVIVAALIALVAGGPPSPAQIVKVVPPVPPLTPPLTGPPAQPPTLPPPNWTPAAPQPYPPLAGGPPPPPHRPTPIIVVPAFPGKRLDRLNLVVDLYEDLSGTNIEAEILNWAEASTDKKFVIVRLPDLKLTSESRAPADIRAEMNRQALKAVKKLERKVIHLVSAKLASDLRRLQPFDWDSPEVKAEKQAEAYADQQRLQELKRDAIARAEDGQSFVQVQQTEHASTFQYTEGTAMRQLRSISVSGW